MGTVSARLSDDLEAEFEAYLQAEQLDRSTAVRRLLAEGLGVWRKRRALDRLRAGEVTLVRAAEIADMNVWDFARLVCDDDVARASVAGDDVDPDA